MVRLLFPATVCLLLVVFCYSLPVTTAESNKEQIPEHSTAVQRPRRVKRLAAMSVFSIATFAFTQIQGAIASQQTAEYREKMIQYAEQQLKILNELKAGQAEIKQEIQELSKEVSWNVVIGLLSPAEIAIHDWFNKMSDHVSTMPKDKDSPRWTVWSRDYRVWAEEVKKGIGNKLLTIHKLMVGQLPGFQGNLVSRYRQVVRDWMKQNPAIYPPTKPREPEYVMFLNMLALQARGYSMELSALKYLGSGHLVPSKEARLKGYLECQAYTAQQTFNAMPHHFYNRPPLGLNLPNNEKFRFNRNGGDPQNQKNHYIDIKPLTADPGKVIVGVKFVRKIHNGKGVLSFAIQQADGSIKLGHKNAHWKEKTEFRDSDLDPVRDENAKYWTWFWVNKVNYVFPPEFVLTGVSFARCRKKMFFYGLEVYGHQVDYATGKVATDGRQTIRVPDKYSKWKPGDFIKDRTLPWNKQDGDEPSFDMRPVTQGGAWIRGIKLKNHHYTSVDRRYGYDTIMLEVVSYRHPVMTSIKRPASCSSSALRRLRRLGK